MPPSRAALPLNGDQRDFARFMEKVVIHKTGCWLWTASSNTYGYGNFGLRGKVVKAHRYSYQTLVGPIPEGLQIDHLCRVRHCVNPDHLEPVTSTENTLRGGPVNTFFPKKTHCPQGHRFTEETTYRSPGRGSRECRRCHTARQQTPEARAQQRRQYEARRLRDKSSVETKA